MDNETTPQQTKKTGSPRFPQLSLQEAIEKAAIIWKEDGKHPVLTAALAKHWDYSEKSSGLRSVIAALGHFGLLEQTTPGSGEYRVTTRAIHILAGSGDEKRTGIRAAALEPRIYREVWEKFGGELPSDENLYSRLLIDWDFNKDSITGFLKDFRATIAFAELEKAVNTAGQDEQQANPEQKPPAPKGDAPSTGAKPAAGAHTQQQHSRPQMSQGTRYLPIPLDIGEAPIPVGMSEDDFELLLNTLQLWKKKIVRPEYPKSAIWHNGDSDKPVTITGVMGEQNGARYFRSSDGTGIPESELEFKE